MYGDGKRIKWMIVVTFIAAVLLLLSGWKIPVIIQLESLNLPEGYETVYPTKVHISDVYWWHIKGEKVIKCDLDYEAAAEYVEAHNSEAKLNNIQIYPYGGVSDIAIYEAEFDEMFWEQPDQDHYITISYFRKI